MDGSRTHRAASRRATDFEDRADHRAETTPTFCYDKQY